MDHRTEATLRLRKEGWTYQQIADHLKLSRSTVAGIIFRDGMTNDGNKAGKRIAAPIRRQIMTMKAEGWKQIAIAESLGVSRSTVRAYWHGLGVK